MKNRKGKGEGMTPTEQALNVIADMTVRMCTEHVGDWVTYKREDAPGLFRALLEAWHDIPGSEQLGIDSIEAMEAQMTHAKMKAMAHLADPVRTHPPPAAQTCGTCRHWTRDVSDADYGQCWLIESLATVEHVNHSCPKWAAKDSAKRG
jgi:hypothetical protein